jgi:C-terminal processing protease CtpA/Prc
MYLPRSVKMPTHGGKEITLLNLATHTAGFPHDPDNMSGADVKEQFETTSGRYSVEQIGQLALRRLPLNLENVIENTAEPVGIGAALDLDQPAHTLRITKVIPNTPASHAGLSAGLIIQKIDGIPTTTRSLAECVNLIRGKAGTTVRLELINPEGHTTNTVELTRQKFLVAK